MYFVIFGVGAGFILISLIVGELFEIEGTSVFSFMRPTLIAIFMVVMGGLGLLLTPRIDWVGGAGIVLFISVVSGLLIAGLINRFILIPLHKAQNTSAFNIQDTIGVVAEVVSPIPQGGYGKIRYNISGSVVTSPAKCDDNSAIACGETVEIIYIEKNTYFVRRQSETTPNSNNQDAVLTGREN
ncbi:MAG: NfeD family protein [Defluviitaleaceae bacterium]|nr:NfeD family protein [Defluviitaleaceae bacterium]